MGPVALYDTTLRDGAQMEGISFSVEDKLKIVRKLDELGIHYIEGGWPGSNPKDAEFFERAKGLRLGHSQLAAFGSTRRPNTRAEADSNLVALVDSGTRVVTIVGKASRLQVTQVLGTTLEENLAMITDSVRFLKGKGLTVFLDAEHFFDGFKVDPEYSLSCLRVAEDAGADAVVLCDTNGGSLSDHIVAGVQAALGVTPHVGIHTHNDAELAVANSLVAVRAGATQVQGTINGYGERCGNANLCSIIPDLELKMRIDCLGKERLAHLSEVSRFVSELANLAPNPHLPWVGSSAFAHKGGLHVSAIAKWEDSYQHASPEAVGNQKRVVVSELSGRSNVLYKAKELGLDLDESGPAVSKVLDSIKTMENQGFQYDGAEASFELVVRRLHPEYVAPFEVLRFRQVTEPGKETDPSSGRRKYVAAADLSVAVRYRTGTREEFRVRSEGVGPVDALYKALRASLSDAYPGVTGVTLTDYKVHIIDAHRGTESRARVLIESSNGSEKWWTVGTSQNAVEASLTALVDGLEYWIVKHADTSGSGAPPSKAVTR